MLETTEPLLRNVLHGGGLIFENIVVGLNFGQVLTVNLHDLTMYAIPSSLTRDTFNRLTLEVEPGKVRYLGASSMSAWQFAKMLYVADRHGWTRFVSMQNHYNLVYREEEREMLPLCLEEGIGVIPWSPLARGFRRLAERRGR